MRIRRQFCLWLCLILCLWCAAARAEGVRIYSFPADQPPRELLDMAFAIPAEQEEIRLTFAGDCTLGSEPEYRQHAGSFCKTVEREGYAYPFSGLAPLFAQDDATLVNLEGVLSTSTAGRAEKKFTFIGDPAYTEVLTLGSVECVTLANNHTLDFGRRGWLDTCHGLEEAGIGYVHEENVLVVEKGGYRIGITASAFALSPGDEQRLAEQIMVLRELGCLAVVHVMHAGVEYAEYHSLQQQKVAEAAVGLGADLVVGHHPHVPQEAGVISGAPVIYSLGNCCFGGNLNPSVREGLLLQVCIAFEEGERASLEWTLHPICITGGESGNDYCPQLLSGDEARQVMERITRPGGLRFSQKATGGFAPDE